MTDLELQILEAEEAAERVEDAAKLAAEATYWALLAEIDAAWKLATKHEVVDSITDACVDSENAMHEVYGSSHYWRAVYVSAKMCAGMRAEEAGYDINKVLGRSIY
jgi:hypothetical protein